MEKEIQRKYLECERITIFLILMMCGGFMGSYTYLLKGGVFCNAQTSNIMLLGLALGNQDWKRAAYLLIPISAYLLGAFVSEILPVYVRKAGVLRWDTLLIGIEIVVLVIIGFLPDSVPVQVSQVSINFICSMQYNTFRQAQGIPMATTFCTNHLRQTGLHLAIWLRKKEKKSLKRSQYHGEMILSFVIGSFLGTIACNLFGHWAIWGAALLLLLAFGDLLFADRTKEKGKLYQVPSGH
ncbi:MAG: YoaK family protein [Lachnospiraceae bacterium]|nr:YoaK family protein [Lachnospiraceae bacterium]